MNNGCHNGDDERNDFWDFGNRNGNEKNAFLTCVNENGNEKLHSQYLGMGTQIAFPTFGNGNAALVCFFKVLQNLYQT